MVSKLLDAASASNPVLGNSGSTANRPIGLPLLGLVLYICTQKALTDWEEGKEEIPDRGSCRRRDRKGFTVQGSSGKGMCVCHRFVVGGMNSEQRTAHWTAWSGEKQTEHQIEPHQHFLSCQAAGVPGGPHRTSPTVQ